MFTVSWLWMNLTFIAPFLFGTILVLPKITKRKHFILKTILAYVVLWVWTVIWTYLSNAATAEARSNMFFTHITFFVQIVVMLGYIIFSYHTNIWGAIFATTVAYSLQHFTQRLHIISLNMIRMILGKDIPGLYVSWYSILIWAVITCGAYAAWYFLLFRKMNPDTFGKIDTMKKQIIISVIVIIASIFVNSAIALQSNNDRIVSTLGYLLSVIISFLVILVDYGLIVEERQRTENEKLNLLLIEGKKDYEANKGSIDILNIKLHDIKHLLQTLNTSTSAETVQNIKDSLTEFEQRFKTGNEAIDVIVNRKEIECISNNIQFTCFLDARGLDYISAYELYTLFDNAIGNAIAAAMNCEDERKHISIHGKKKDGKLKITFTNYIPLDAKITIVRGFPVTNKDKNYHGFGIRSMQMLTEKHKGKIKCEIFEDVFNLHVTLPIVE